MFFFFFKQVVGTAHVMLIKQSIKSHFIHYSRGAWLDKATQRLELIVRRALFVYRATDWTQILTTDFNNGCPFPPWAWF